ncbi:50S ribosomal protein L10 [Yinghuangia seranimata]|uniref:50S ribosomal protein L10 n=1 Tax=Yinghuangia seranimata TaxID=408067 RepID=UPI00248C01A6|nr:50S ribosomal protein L10 [Yinghuangia seranimata]MDI2126902.1 50S ribosomal protein L10 [Yinghuangia seranimata]
MARPDKAAGVAEIADKFRGSNATVLTEYRGLSVAKLKELRRSLAGNAEYAVVKNTLTKIAANEAGITELDDLLVGPSAVAFVTGDPVEAAKSLRDFAKANPLLVIKGGVLEGKALTADEIKKLADLESREVLLAKLAGAMKASMAKAAATFQAPLTEFVRTAEALRVKREAEQGGAGEPAPAAEATEEAAAE